MAVGLNEPVSLLPIRGIRLAAISAGIKKHAGLDLVLISLSEGSEVIAVFTQNKFRAAPVQIAEKHLKSMPPRFLLINSGNANAGTGESGYSDAVNCCRMTGALMGLPPMSVLPFSTGVIGQNLPMTCFEKSIPLAYDVLSEDNWLDAAHGIMTTDTVAKAISKQVIIDGVTVTITGIAKGAGMIKPNMATMLSYVATDANIDKVLLKKSLLDAVDVSFNSITVDGDTSTNDSCVLMATGQAENKCITNEGDHYSLFASALTEVCQFLAQAIIRDGEGANRFVTIKVINAETIADARQVAYTIAHSPLVKTALFAGDPNWGRILAAVGRSEVESLDVDKVLIYLDDVCIVRNGGRDSNYTEEQGQRVMSQDEITITVDMQIGEQTARIWTTDLSYEYVKINAEYRT